MSTTVTYKGNTIATVENNTKTLKTSGKYLEDDITLTDVTSGGGSNYQAKTGITPTESSQTITADAGYDALSSVQINAISSSYIGSGITQRSSTDLTENGATVTAPAGYYENDATKTIASGSATISSTVSITPSISVNSSTGLITATNNGSVGATPAVTPGYVDSGTLGSITVHGSNTSQMTVQAAQTIHPSSSGQTIAAGTYLTGTQTISGVTVSGLEAGNIKSGVTVKIGDSDDDDCVTSVLGTLSTGVTLLGSKEITDSCTSTTAAAVTTLALGASAFTSNGVLYVKIRDKAGPRSGYFFGTDVFFFNRNPAQGSTSTLSLSANSWGGLSITHRIASDGSYASYSVYNGYGLYAYSISSAGTLTIRHRYNNTYSLTVNGTYVIEAYLLTGPFASWYPVSTT